MKYLIGISGSTRKNSSNYQLLSAIAQLLKPSATLEIFEGIASLPHFNPENDNEEAPREVTHFRSLLDKADGIIICTPEYAHGVPGSLKNAIDWTVSSCQFSHKPTALFTASTDGQFGHKALLETLKVIEAKDIDEMQLVIPFIKTKVKESMITDETTKLQVLSILKKLLDVMQEK